MNQLADFIETADENGFEEDGLSFQEFDITSSPNDFNVRTIVDFIESGVFRIPVFQRNYVWTINKASKLIESLILGLPVPQVFLYQIGRNRYLVIDGQQRLMSIYFFLKTRFPLMNKRGALRKVFDETGSIPAEVFEDDEFFSKFNLRLPGRLPQVPNELNGLNYETLGDQQASLDLRTIRCVFVRQNFPQNDDSSIFEIFNRLNTGGENLTAQEIRISLYNSEFMKMLSLFNADKRWRDLIDQPETDLRMRDVEILLRGFAMLTRGSTYAPSMAKFLNKFAKDMQDESPENVELLGRILSSFLDMCVGFPAGIFGTSTRKVNISVFESVFAAACEAGFRSGEGNVTKICESKISMLKKDERFLDAASTRSTDTEKVQTRLRRAKEILMG